MIVVTGATGLVGGHLLWHLLQTNDKVIAICRNTSNKDALNTIFSFYCNDPSAYIHKIEWRHADVLDAASLLNAFEGVTEIYHCAAVVSLNKSTTSMSDVNVLGTRNVVQAALHLQVSKFCFVSSIAACGRSNDNQPVTEDCVWTHNSKRSEYSISKYYSEQEVWNGISKGLPAVIVNPGVILGISPNTEGSAQLFAQVANGLQFYSHGGTGYVDVQDVVKIMIALMNKNKMGERYILVSQNCSNKDILSWIADGLDKPRPFIPIGKSLLLTIGFSAQHIGRIFGFQPPINLSMARTAASRMYYSNSKIINELNYDFSSVKSSIIAICKKYKTHAI